MARWRIDFEFYTKSNSSYEMNADTQENAEKIAWNIFNRYNANVKDAAVVSSKIVGGDQYA